MEDSPLYPSIPLLGRMLTFGTIPNTAPCVQSDVEQSAQASEGVKEIHDEESKE